MDSSFWERIRAVATPAAAGDLTLIPYPPQPALPTSTQSYQCRLIGSTDIPEIVRFLYKNFHYSHHKKDGKSSPDLIIPSAALIADLSEGAYGVLCYSAKSPELIGCVWARPIGHIAKQGRESNSVNIYLVEHLCISEEWRGKGITRLLLYWIEYHRPNKDVRFIFLKEGRIAPTVTVASDRYIFRRFAGKILRHLIKYTSQQRVRQITQQEAYARMKDTVELLINHLGYLSSRRTQLWLAEEAEAILAITDSYQYHPLDGRKIGLITGWWCPSEDSRIKNAAQAAIFESQPYTWLWSPASYIQDRQGWDMDGQVSWQPYLWSAPTPMKNIFFIL